MTTTSQNFTTVGSNAFTTSAVLLNGSIICTCFGGLGAAGTAASSATGGAAGKGAKVVGTVPASPSQAFTIWVAGNGSGTSGGSGLHTGGAGSAAGSYGTQSTGEGGNGIGGGGGGSSGVVSGGTTYLEAGGGSGGAGGAYGNNPPNVPTFANGPAGVNGSQSGLNGNSGVFMTGGAGVTSAGASGSGGGWTGNGAAAQAGTSATGGAPGTGACGSTAPAYGGTSTGAGSGVGPASGASGDCHAGTGVTSVTYTTGGSTSSGSVSIQWTYADAPNAPTGLSPATSSTIFISGSTAFSWTYNPGTDSGTQSEYCLRFVDNTNSTTYYWDAVNQVMTTTQTWVSSSSNSVTIPDTAFNYNAHSYSWSVATAESHYNLQSPFSTANTFTTNGTWNTSMTISDSVSISTMVPIIAIQTAMTIADQATVLFTYGAPNFVPGQLNTIGTPLPVFAQSVIYQTFHNIVGVQFATVQSNAVQLIPNDRFQNSTYYQTYNWNLSTDFQPSGSAALSFDATTNSVVINHSNQAAIVPGHSLIRPPVSPVLAEIAQGAGSLVVSGLLSPQVTPSLHGRLYAAVKFTPLTPLHNPIQLQLLLGGATPSSQTVLNTWNITGNYNQQQTSIFAFNVGDYAPSGTNLQLQVVQSNTGSQNDIFSVQALSLFDEGIYWQFSVDAGTTWWPGMGVKNNPYGVVQFPAPGNKFMWQATFYQPNLILNEVEFRPLYQGSSAFLDPALGMKGATVEFNDIWAQIQTDPLFNQTRVPVPRNWYAS